MATDWLVSIGKKVILLEYGNMMIEYGKTFPTFLQSKCPLD